MEDKLKKYVQDHRDDFDSFEPRPDLWQDICRELDEKKSGRIIPFYQRSLWRYAASVILLMGIGYGLVQYGKSMRTGEPVAAMEGPLRSIAPEMAEVETYYLSVIQEKQKERRAYDLKKLGVDQDFSGELGRLDSSYVQLKKELATNPNKQPVIDAMVQNLQIRIRILNQQLEVLNRIKQIKTENQDENVSI
jgi:hypothetical protein